MAWFEGVAKRTLGKGWFDYAHQPDGELRIMASKITKVYKSDNPDKKKYYDSLDLPVMHECTRCRHTVDPKDKVEKANRRYGWDLVCKKCGCKSFYTVKIIPKEKTK